jgi:hypothetical protein
MKVTGLILLLALAGTAARAQSKACRKHPEWTTQECALVARKKLFVGMTREMIDAEKPRSCVRDRHPAHPEAGMVSFVCETQWDRSEPDHTLPFMLHFKLADGRVTAFFYN